MHASDADRRSICDCWRLYATWCDQLISCIILNAHLPPPAQRSPIIRGEFPAERPTGAMTRQEDATASAVDQAIVKCAQLSLPALSQSVSPASPVRPRRVATCQPTDSLYTVFSHYVEICCMPCIAFINITNSYERYYWSVIRSLHVDTAAARCWSLVAASSWICRSVDFITGRQRSCKPCTIATIGMSVCLSVCLSVTRWHWVKTTQARITKSSPTDSPRILVFGIKNSSRNSKGVTPSEDVKWEWGRKNSQFSADNSPYLRKGARPDQSYY